MLILISNIQSMDEMCQSGGNYIIMSSEPTIEPIVYVKEDECPSNEMPANSGASYVELRSLRPSQSQTSCKFKLQF